MPSEQRSRESPLAGELRAGGRLAGDCFVNLVDGAEQTHRAISGRALGAVGAARAPAGQIHDAVARFAYASTRAIGSRSLRLGTELAARAVPCGSPGADQRTGPRVFKGVLNGLCGDRLAAEGNGLAIEMTCLPRGLPRTRVAVFVHGLCETEDAWFLHQDRCSPYGPRLRDELGYTPVYVRYNSGLEIESNGVRLATLIEDLFGAWTVPIIEIVLIGHSMGGLVARAACEFARAGSGMRWASRLKHLVALGTPHHGAPLERTAAVAERVLSWIPETRALASLIDARSTGIKGLGRPLSLPYNPEVSHHFYSAGLYSNGGRVTEAVLGDLLVPRTSAWDTARGSAVALDAGHYRHLEGANHFDLLGHPAVADQLIRWLGVTELSRGERSSSTAVAAFCDHELIGQRGARRR